jgi:hypothetical protein
MANCAGIPQRILENGRLQASEVLGGNADKRVEKEGEEEARPLVAAVQGLGNPDNCSQSLWPGGTTVPGPGQPFQNLQRLLINSACCSVCLATASARSKVG